MKFLIVIRNILEKKESSSSEVLDIILNTLEDPSLANNTIKCKISAVQLLAYVMEDGGDILINDTNYIERLKTIITKHILTITLAVY